jgi:type IV pilus assembly protein PilA
MNVNPGAAPQPKQGKSAVVIIVIILAVVGGCCVTGILAAIAIPNFIKYQSRSKQGECKVELRRIYQAQVAHFDEKKGYADDFNALGHMPDAVRYTYFIGMGAPKGPKQKGAKAVALDQLPALEGGVVVGVEGECPDCTFTAACAGNVDNDADIDVWSISTAQRGAVGPGEVHHDVDDSF